MQNNGIDKKTVFVIDILAIIVLVLLFIILPKKYLIYFLIVWLFVMLIANYFLIVKNTDIANDLSSADKSRNGIFRNQVKALQRARESIILREPVFMNLEADNKMKDVYILISKQVYSNIKSSIQYMSTYDYVRRPNPTYLNELCQQTEKLLQQLSELVEYQIKLESTVDDIDTNKVDSMLDALKEITNQTKF